MSKHSPEPWEMTPEDHRIIYYRDAEKGRLYRVGVVDSSPNSEANTRRIVACVNACRGIDTEKLEYCASCENNVLALCRETFIHKVK